MSAMNEQQAYWVHKDLHLLYASILRDRDRAETFYEVEWEISYEQVQGGWLATRRNYVCAPATPYGTREYWEEVISGALTKLRELHEREKAIASLGATEYVPS